MEEKNVMDLDVQYLDGEWEKLLDLMKEATLIQSGFQNEPKKVLELLKSEFDTRISSYHSFSIKVLCYLKPHLKRDFEESLNRLQSRVDICSEAVEKLETVSEQIELVSSRINSFREEKHKAMLDELKRLVDGFDSCLLILSSPNSHLRIGRVIDPPLDLNGLKAQAYSKFRKIGDSFDIFTCVGNINIQVGCLRELLFAYRKLESRGVKDLEFVVCPCKVSDDEISPPISPASSQKRNADNEPPFQQKKEKKRRIGKFWTDDEILLFRKGIEELGWSNWEKIRERYFFDSGRSADSLRNYARANLKDLKEHTTNLTTQLISIMSDYAAFSNKMASLVGKNQE